jgi:rhamnose utilization protein RhaD (predicted bifunctional aldolase and dehydrogenase)
MTHHIPYQHPEIDSLRKLSLRLGSDRLLVQASSGNTSVKLDQVLWIKASGKWMAQADAIDFLIPVQLARAKRCLEEGRTIPETETASSGSVSASIETAMHAILPHNVVIHVHSVNAIAWTLRRDAPTRLISRLSGFNWQWVPYTRSGPELAQKIQDIRSRFPLTDVFVLGNHGLVVCGANCESAERLLTEVEECLQIEPRPPMQSAVPPLQESIAGSNWFLPGCAMLQALATDPISRRILSGGVLYPCQAIFLPSTVRVQKSSPLRRLRCFQQHQSSIVMEEDAVLCSKAITRAEHEMLIGLANVVQRIDATAALRYLSLSEVTDALGAGGAHYRSVATANALSMASISDRAE